MRHGSGADTDAHGSRGAPCWPSMAVAPGRRWTALAPPLRAHAPAGALACGARTPPCQPRPAATNAVAPGRLANAILQWLASLGRLIGQTGRCDRDRGRARHRRPVGVDAARLGAQRPADRVVVDAGLGDARRARRHDPAHRHHEPAGRADRRTDRLPDRRRPRELDRAAARLHRTPARQGRRRRADRLDRGRDRGDARDPRRRPGRRPDDRAARAHRRGRRRSPRSSAGRPRWRVRSGRPSAPRSRP